MIDQKTWEEERAYLIDTTGKMQTEIREIDHRFTIGVSAADEASEESIRHLDELRRRELLRALESPYFARIDFTANDDEMEKIYIGKTAVYDGDRSILVTDWRAPISSLYYDGRTGPTEYKSPKGVIRGNLSLKRNFAISKGKLERIEDIDIIAREASEGVSLKADISHVNAEITADKMPKSSGTDAIDVSTIDKMLVSSLSTLADTRLKSIVATIQAEQNSVIRADMHKRHIVQGAAGSGKTSVALHRIAYLAYVLGKEFRPENFLILTQSSLLLNYISAILPDLGVERVPQRSFEQLVKRITRLSFDVDGADIRSRYKTSFDILSDIDDFLANNPKHTGKGRNVLSTYREFLEHIGHEAGRKYMPKTDDLAPLLYMHMKVVGIPDMRLRHIVIDEAQDFSAMQLTVLQMVFRSATFTVFGDLAQSIYPHGVQVRWEDINQQVWNGEAIILHLEKSYRSTVEIMEAASRLLEALPNVPKGVAVIRHGEPVTYTDVGNERERTAACARLVIHRLQQGYSNIAVILSHANLCSNFTKQVNKYLANTLKRDIITLTTRDRQYEGGICVLPSALSKGLEFDAVIVADAERYPKSDIGIKLQYVSMTRAMHTLDVVRVSRK